MNFSSTKIFLSGFLLVTLQAKVFAQSSYVPFPEGDAVWHVAVRPQYALLPYHDQYMYVGDTSFNSFDYKKIDYKAESVHLPDGTLQYNDEGVIGYLRQDSLARKVFYVPKIDTTEYLLYDFDLNVGDTVPLTCLHPWLPRQIVIGQDSVLVGSDYRKVFILLPPNGGMFDTVKIIEGIGCSSGPFFEAGTFCFESCIELACFQQDGESVYVPVEYAFGFYPFGFCHIVGVSEIENDQAYISIQPNLISNGEEFNITNPGRSELEVSVLDIFGNLVWKRRFIHDPQIEISSSQFSDGIYFVKILIDNRFLSTQKLVVQ